MALIINGYEWTSEDLSNLVEALNCVNIADIDETELASGASFPLTQDATGTLGRVTADTLLQAIADAKTAASAADAAADNAQAEADELASMAVDFSDGYLTLTVTEE